jgi:hypothetical protein
MCSAARKRIEDAGLADAISVFHQDVRELGRFLPREVRDEVRALHGRSILNEFFRRGSDEPICFLRNLRELFPDRLLFVVDYYGKLTRLRHVSRRYRHTLLHDMAQILSGQGVPPEDLPGWTAVYEAAGCSLRRAYEGESAGIDWFVHVVQL